MIIYLTVYLLKNSRVFKDLSLGSVWRSVKEFQRMISTHVESYFEKFIRQTNLLPHNV